MLITEKLATEMLITEKLATEMLITEKLVTEMLITEKLATEMLITEMLATESVRLIPPSVSLTTVSPVPATPEWSVSPWAPATSAVPVPRASPLVMANTALNSPTPALPVPATQRSSVSTSGWETARDTSVAFVRLT